MEDNFGYDEYKNFMNKNSNNNIFESKRSKDYYVESDIGLYSKNEIMPRQIYVVDRANLDVKKKQVPKQKMSVKRKVIAFIIGTGLLASATVAGADFLLNGEYYDSTTSESKVEYELEHGIDAGEKVDPRGAEAKLDRTVGEVIANYVDSHNLGSR